MIKFAFACLIASVAAQGGEDSEWVYRYQGKAYQSWDAQSKHARLVRELFDVQEPTDIDYELHKLFDLDMNKTTCRSADEIPGRPKMVHQQGVVASVRYKSLENHEYTGLFKGANYGIMRLSDSGILVDGYEESNPSVALKFMIDYEQSENLVFMIDWNNQQTRHFFPKDDDGYKLFTTHPEPFIGSDYCNQETILRKMLQASKTPFSSGTGRFSAIMQDGTEIEDEVFPYEMLLKPNEQVGTQSISDPFDYLTGLEVDDGQPFFDVYARDEPKGDLNIIGGIYVEKLGIVRSTFGDERLFFRHEPFGRDLSRLRKQGQKDRAKKWRNFERDRPDYSLPPKFEDDFDFDSYNDEVGNWTETVLEAMIKTPSSDDPDTGCPFAWLLQ